MTEEKICPIMSRPYYEQSQLIPGEGVNPGCGGLTEIPCIRERCAAWVKCKNPGLAKDRPDDCLDYCEVAKTISCCMPHCSLLPAGGDSR